MTEEAPKTITPDFDFGSYAAEHFERMQTTAAAPAFVSALEG